jgi:hypothetical protein
LDVKVLLVNTSEDTNVTIELLAGGKVNDTVVPVDIPLKSNKILLVRSTASTK